MSIVGKFIETESRLEIMEWGKAETVKWLFWDSDEKGNHIVDTLNTTELYTLKLLIVYYMNFTSVIQRKRGEKSQSKEKENPLAHIFKIKSLKNTYLLSFPSPFYFMFMKIHLWKNVQCLNY